MVFNCYGCHIDVSEGGLVRHSITISFSALQYKVVSIGARSCRFYENLARPTTADNYRYCIDQYFSKFKTHFELFKLQFFEYIKLFDTLFNPSKISFMPSERNNPPAREACREVANLIKLFDFI